MTRIHTKGKLREEKVWKSQGMRREASLPIGGITIGVREAPGKRGLWRPQTGKVRCPGTVTVGEHVRSQCVELLHV